jgi:hypothetical protein
MRSDMALTDTSVHNTKTETETETAEVIDLLDDLGLLALPSEHHPLSFLQKDDAPVDLMAERPAQ